MATATLDPIYKELAKIMNMEHSETMQKILAKLASPEQAKIVLELPNPPEEIAKKLNISKEKVESTIQELVEKGLVVLTKRGAKMARSEGQLHDLQTNKKFDKELGKEYWSLWRQLLLEERPERLKKRAEQKSPTGRIIPRLGAVKDIPGIMPFEDVREILKAHQPVAVIPCACKRVNEETRSCGLPDETCIIFGNTATFNLNARKTGRQLTYDEALKLIEKLDQYPVVHLVPNMRDVSLLLCNCHGDCCDVMIPYLDEKTGKISKKMSDLWKKTHAPSRFVATVDTTKCRSCKLCVTTRCQFGASEFKLYPELDAERAYVDPQFCMGCGVCVITCPGKARTMKLVRPPEHVPAELGRTFWSGDSAGT